MALRQAVILCASFLGAIAASVDSSECVEFRGDKAGNDGYTLLAVGATFELRNYSLSLQLEKTVSCVRTTTASKNEDQHTVMENVTFKYNDQWGGLQQKFRFFGERGQYNTMSPTDTTGNSEQEQGQQVVSRRSGEGDTGQPDDGSGELDSIIVPPGNYTFKVAATGCAVLLVDLSEEYYETEDQKSENGESNTAQISEREEAPASTKPQCMLWVQKGANAAGNCCEFYFNSECSAGTTDYVGTGVKCDTEEPASGTQQ
uniref:Lipocalin n=1 Tax=Rhipicephalus appendiculatus TaxID=34631 RepID=A0A131YRE9_RHIAP